MAVTNHSALSTDKMVSVEMRCGEMRLVIRTLLSLRYYHDSGSRCVDRVTSGVCDCVFVCVSALQKINDLSYQSPTWHLGSVYSQSTVISSTCRGLTRMVDGLLLWLELLSRGLSPGI